MIKYCFLFQLKSVLSGQGRAREQRGRGAEGLGYFKWVSSLTVTIKGEHRVHRGGGEGDYAPPPPQKKGKKKKEKGR